jgi:putative ATP-dependent endonuclease of the OLD family
VSLSLDSPLLSPREHREGRPSPLQRFRGFADATLFPRDHVTLVGEPRAGRSDIITGLRRVLDPRSTAARVNPVDVHRSLPVEGADGSLAAALTEVEVSLIDLGVGLEQMLDNRLEALNPATGEPATKEDSADAVLGFRLCYRLRYDEHTGTGEHWVDYPKLSDPINGAFARASRQEREALPFIALHRAPALQLRAEGLLRALVEDADAPGLNMALETLGIEVAKATEAFSSVAAIRAQIAEVLSAGAGLLLELSEDHPENRFSFVTEDGSVAALLRAVQPAVHLDDAGVLPLSAHGSTATGVLTVAEGAVSARAPESVVVVDDFADDLDAAAAEYLAAKLRRDVGQLWLSTRRPEAVRAFPTEEVVRLTRSHGSRAHHRLTATTDRKERGVRRQLQLQLLPAMTARTVVLLEGPHDVEGYGAVADRRLRVSGIAPPSAYGMRLIAPPGGEGGKDRLPRLAQLAIQLGFRVRVVVDHDGVGKDLELLTVLQELADVVIRLPERMAVERALVVGLPESNVRETLEWLIGEYGLNRNIDGLGREALEEMAVSALKDKGGLHQPWIDALPGNTAPPAALRVLEAIVAPPPADNGIVEVAAL